MQGYMCMVMYEIYHVEINMTSKKQAKYVYESFAQDPKGVRVQESVSVYSDQSRDN